MDYHSFTIRFDTWVRAIIVIIVHFLTTPEFFSPLTLQLQHSRKQNKRNWRQSIPESSPVDGHPTQGVTNGTAPADKLDPHADLRLPLVVGENGTDGSPSPATTELDEEYATSPSSDDVLMVQQSEASTLTDICNTEDLPEVNLLSLLEEQIPRYILRADTLTNFAGYDNADWVQFPCLPVDADLNLSPEVIAETLKYFTLCGQRVSQMTKTYNDIEAVTRLLEEKERDLELAARIGQTLLDKNRELEHRNEALEEQLTESNDKVHQLQYVVSLKDDLLRVYVQDYNGEESPSDENFDLKNIDVEALQKRVRGLEDENTKLQDETTFLRTEAISLEEREAQLVTDCFKQLTEAQERLKLMTEELNVKSDVSNKQQDEMNNLFSTVITLESKIKTLTLENAELTTQLSAANDSQKSLTSELADLESKYKECLLLLEEQNEELKALRRRHLPRALRQHYSTFSPFLPHDSLASELEDSMRKDQGFPDGYSPDERRDHNTRVMETAKFVRRSSRQQNMTSDVPLPSTAWSSSSGNESCESVCGSNRSSFYLTEDTECSDGYQADTDSVYGSCNSSTLGRPGLPGSNDLETALRRLSLKKTSSSLELKQPEDSIKPRFRSGELTPTPCRTPESVMSTGSDSHRSEFSRVTGVAGYQFRIPEKLQIVKPMEGSVVLHQWKRLATPHMGGLFDDRPGVSIKGECKIDMDSEMYTLSDPEEDDDASFLLGKCAENTSSTYTYTQSKIMHPTDEYPSNTLVTSSIGGAKVSTQVYNPTIRKRSTCTFSMSRGIASVLSERGIGACTESVSLPGNPKRYESIVSETISSRVSAVADPVYTKAELQTPIDTISVTARPLLHPEFNALFEQIKDIGLQKLNHEQSADCETDTETLTECSDSENEFTKLPVSTATGKLPKSFLLLTPAETSAAVSNILDAWKTARKKVKENMPKFTPPIRELPSYIAPMRDLPLYFRTMSSGGKTTTASPTSSNTTPVTAEPMPALSVALQYSSYNGTSQSKPLEQLAGKHMRKSNTGLVGALVSPTQDPVTLASARSSSPDGSCGVLHSLNLATKITTSKVRRSRSGGSAVLVEPDSGVGIMRQEFYNDPNLK